MDNPIIVHLDELNRVLIPKTVLREVLGDSDIKHGMAFEVVPLANSDFSSDTPSSGILLRIIEE
jgi:hypothetical protein